MLRSAAIASILIALTVAGARGTDQAQDALAAEKKPACLTKTEQKVAVSSGQAVTLAQAIRAVRGSVRGRGAREVVNARLCREQNGLVYMLTVLARDGKVTRIAVEASSGKVVDAR
jgi:uncharacterized membrane protein YkoI